MRRRTSGKPKAAQPLYHSGTVPVPVMNRTNISSGTPWEPLVGYSRAVRVGNMVFVSGTTSTDEAGRLVGPGDPYAQTRQILRNIESALMQAGARLEDVVRTRIFVTDISVWDEIGRAHGSVFRQIRPAATMVEVRRLILPEMLVEIEADAVIAGDARYPLDEPISGARTEPP